MGKGEVEQCYSETWVASISMVGSVLSVRAWFTVQCLVRFTGMMWFWVE